MHRLYLLGRVTLVDPRGNEVRTVLAQPKRLGLLAYLAAAVPTGACRRDRLFGVFWPELTQERARKALNKAVYFLRQALGEDALVSRGADEVAVDPGRVWCDAVAFADAVTTDDPSEGLDLYRGDLLPSFYLQGAAEFDAWVEAERTRLRRLAARAARALARQREVAGQVTTAIVFARRAVELSDEDERAVRELLELLDRLGDRAGALFVYDKFARHLASEFGARPAAETEAVIARIRARSDPADGADAGLEAAPLVLPSRGPPVSDPAVAAAFRARGYQIERELGRGGMATVYLAHDARHERHVALKILAPAVNALGLAERFAAEIRVTARLNHPHILPLFDSGNVEGMLFYAMPFVEGESLRARLKREKQLPVDDTIALIATLAGALEYAHKSGIVHRDIKPENVLIQGGQPLLADFGIALALNSAGAERLAGAGLSLGSPPYMSPEQAVGALTAGPPSDIYSLAAVAYEALAGEPPFTGANAYAVLARVMLEMPRPIRATRPVPEPIEAAILRGLAKHPADRFASATEFAAALQVAGDARPSARRPVLSRRAVGAATLALSAAALGATALLVRRVSGPPTGDAPVLSRIAVFPFAVQAGPELAYLGDGLMGLLSEALDGAGQLRRVDPFALTSHLRRTGEALRDPDRARRVASHFGAGRFVLGSVADAGDEVRVSASLYEVRRRAGPLREASAAGHRDRIGELVTEMARRLLAGVPLGPGAHLEDVATVQAANYTAFKAYLEGEALLRRGVFDSAAATLREAVAADSTFALAWYRLSQALGWSGTIRGGGLPAALESIDRAYRHLNRLSQRDSLMVATRWAWHHGEDRLADSLAQVVTGQYPDLVEAWQELAAVRLFYGWRRGQPTSHAREPLSRALALDPEYPLAVAHARWLALYERRYADAQALPAQRSMRTNRFFDSQRRVVAFILGDPATRDSIARGLPTVDDVGLFWTAWQLMAYSDSLDAARKLLTELATATDRAPVARAYASLCRALLEASSGRWARARAEFDRAAVPTPGVAMALPIRFAVLPGFERPDSELRAMRDALRERALPPFDDLAFFEMPAALHPWLMEYLLGVLGARLGDSTEALRHARALDEARTPPDTFQVRHDLALEIRALVALRAGRPADALALVERVRFMMPLATRVSESRRTFSQFLRAELLRQLHRDEEALGWYGTIGFHVGPDVALAALAHLRLGEIHERRGNFVEAAHHYGRFVARWRGADPEYQPLVRDVEARLARISRKGPRRSGRGIAPQGAGESH